MTPAPATVALAAVAPVRVALRADEEAVLVAPIRLCAAARDWVAARDCWPTDRPTPVGVPMAPARCPVTVPLIPVAATGARAPATAAPATGSATAERPCAASPVRAVAAGGRVATVRGCTVAARPDPVWDSVSCPARCTPALMFLVAVPAPVAVVAVVAGSALADWVRVPACVAVDDVPVAAGTPRVAARAASASFASGPLRGAVSAIARAQKHATTAIAKSERSFLISLSD